MHSFTVNCFTDKTDTFVSFFVDYTILFDNLLSEEKKAVVIYTYGCTYLNRNSVLSNVLLFPSLYRANIFWKRTHLNGLWQACSNWTAVKKITNSFTEPVYIYIHWSQSKFISIYCQKTWISPFSKIMKMRNYKSIHQFVQVKQQVIQWLKISKR